MKITELKEWRELVAHREHMGNFCLKSAFRAKDDRIKTFSHQSENIFLDYSRNYVNEDTISTLIKLAESLKLTDEIDGLFSGRPINTSENRPVLHTALRDQSDAPFFLDGINIKSEIDGALLKMQELADKFHSQHLLGSTGKPITHVITLGIGGSYMGPLMCAHALKSFALTPIKFLFLAHVDHGILKELPAETSLFIISSKSFSTTETIINSKKAINWLQQELGNKCALEKQVIAITAHPDKALQLGISKDNIFPLWEWVGGRYSIWSAIGLPLLLMIGSQQFKNFLKGGYYLDQHFRTTELRHNIPVILGLLSIWYINFFDVKAHAVIPYSNKLKYLVPYLQQAEMESNGKTFHKNGQDTTYATGSILFGEEGTIGQHAYHQLLHQGSHLIPIDFILEADLHTYENQFLIASALSQAQALLLGNSETKDYKHIKGNRPSTILALKGITPYTLGLLIALYEHKIFVQGAIWGINSFDQWGVELGKQLLPNILNALTHPDSHDDAIMKQWLNTFKLFSGNT